MSSFDIKNGKWSFFTNTKKQWIQNRHAFKNATVNTFYVKLAQETFQRVNYLMGCLILKIVQNRLKIFYARSMVP